MRWECFECNRQLEAVPSSGVDWDGKPCAVGPNCPGCGLEMIPASDGDATAPLAAETLGWGA